MPTSGELIATIKDLAKAEGFGALAIASAGCTPPTEAYQRWIAEGWHGGMSYMEKNMPQRMRPDVLVPGAKSVICMAAGYGVSAFAPSALIARYACGRDYHKVLKRRCIAMMDRLREAIPQFDGRAFVDSAPVMERSLAAACGLGFIARNGCLVVPGMGSYVLLCEIVCNLELEAGTPLKDTCGDCGRCQAACPTNAIRAGNLIDSRRCISYLTIEHAGEIPPEFWPRMGTSVFGCDACQQACPLNDAVEGDKPQCHSPIDAELAPREDVRNLSLASILKWTPADWDMFTRGSALRRATFDMFIRNAIIAAGNSGDRSLIELLHALRAEHPSRGVMIDWAIDRLKEDSP